MRTTTTHTEAKTFSVVSSHIPLPKKKEERRRIANRNTVRRFRCREKAKLEERQRSLEALKAKNVALKNEKKILEKAIETVQLLWASSVTKNPTEPQTSLPMGFQQHQPQQQQTQPVIAEAKALTQAADSTSANASDVLLKLLYESIQHQQQQEKEHEQQQQQQQQQQLLLQQQQQQQQCGLVVGKQNMTNCQPQQPVDLVRLLMHQIIQQQQQRQHEDQQQQHPKSYGVAFPSGQGQQQQEPLQALQALLQMVPNLNNM